MKSDQFYGEEDIVIEYIFRKSKTPSDIFIIMFPGVGGRVAGGEWGYIVTVQQINANILFIKSKTEYSKSRMTYRDGKPVIENSIMSLINKCMSEIECKRIIVAGSSMGGFCAIYYGLKNNWDIIAGAPPYSLKNSENLKYAAGELASEDVDWFDSICSKIIRDAGKRGYTKKCFMMWGEGEPNWKKKIHAPKLLKELNEANIKYEYKLYPFADHSTIHSLFPSILKDRILTYIDSNYQSTENLKDKYISPDIALLNNIINKYSKLSNLINESTNDAPYIDMQGIQSMGGELEDDDIIRNYKGILQGEYWGRNFDKPYHITSSETIWSIKRKVTNLTFTQFNKYGPVSFWFQSELLNYCDNHNDREMFLWLVDNAREYFSQETLPKKLLAYWTGAVRRIHYFILFQKLSRRFEITEDFSFQINKEIKKDIYYIFISYDHRNAFGGLYTRTLSLLYAALYYKNNVEMFSALYEAALDIIIYVTDFYFDKNGICIFGQIRMHINLTKQLLQNIKFIETNAFPTSQDYKKLLRKVALITTAVGHMIRPDGKLAALGHTINKKNDVILLDQRESSNFIKKGSNIAFLEDSHSLSYITVNGGSNIHSKIRHCDLLSFTWYYDGKQIFCDTGGGKTPCDEFAASAVAHNAFICDGGNYTTPDYSDWTTIDETFEQESHVVISMSHRLINDVEMYRKLIWINPNIIVLVDEALSDVEHCYEQNFIMNKFKVIQNDLQNVLIAVAPGFSVRIRQLARPKDIALRVFKGNSTGEEESLRGSRIKKGKEFVRGLNLAFAQKGNIARFATVIECHSPDREDKPSEFSVESLKILGTSIIITLEDGRVITEKCSLEIDENESQVMLETANDKLEVKCQDRLMARLYHILCNFLK